MNLKFSKKVPRSSILKPIALYSVILASFVSLPVSYAADKIKQINVTGNYRIETASILNQLQVSEGSNYTKETADRIIKALYSTGMFNNIKVNFAHGKLMVEVEEEPLVVKIDITGNTNLKTNKLTPELYTKIGAALKQNDLQHDVNVIKEMYKRHGRFLIEIKPKTQLLKNHRAQVTFEVTEGPKAVIKEIYFTGNNKYTDRELEAVMLTKRSLWYRFFNSYDVYDPDRIEYDKELLRQFYHSVGYADFRAISAISELAQTKDYFTVHYVIEEGKQYKIGKVSIQNSLENIDNAKLEKIISFHSGDIYNAALIDITNEKMNTMLADLGYPQIVVRATKHKNEKDQVIDISFVVEKGPKVFINHINIVGNYKTQDQVIRRQFKIYEGDLCNRAQTAAGERRLRNLDYFSSIKAYYAPTIHPDKLDLQIEVKEKYTGNIGASAAYNVKEGPTLQFSYVDRNVVGTGKNLAFGPKFGTKSNSFVLGFTNPSLFGTDITSGFHLNWVTNKIEKDDESGLLGVYNRATKDAKGDISSADSNTHPLTKDELESVELEASDTKGILNNNPSFRTFIGYSITQNLSQDIYYLLKAPLPHNVKDLELGKLWGELQKNLTSAIGSTITYDRTDSRVVTKNGYLLALTNEIAGLGGSSKYWKIVGEGKFFKSFVNNRYTLRFSASGGYITNFNSEVLRSSDRFNLGDTDMRGFEYAGLGPRSIATKAPLGGQKYYTFVTEFQFPLGFPKEFDIAGVVFMDIGDVWGLEISDNQQSKIRYNDGNIHLTVGAGVTWNNSTLPIRVDYAFPLIKEEFDKTQTWHIRAATQF